jgi:hypothetical protein
MFLRHCKNCLNNIFRFVIISGDFATFRKTTTCFLMSVCPHGTTPLPLDGYSWNFTLNISRKSVEKIQFSLRLGRHNGYFTWRPMYLTTVSRSFLFRMRSTSDKIHILCSITFCRKSRCVWDNVGKYSTTGQATDDCNMAHAHCMLDN